MKLWIDTDGGVDDAISIMLAIGKLDIEGISGVFGNVGLPQVMHNIQKILQVMEAPDIAVYSGASGPIIHQASTQWPGHGPDGLGGSAGVVNSEIQTTRNDAVSAIIQAVHANPNELTLIGLGPMTNIALAILIDPSIVELCCEIVFMGATTKRWNGNTTKAAEFNVASDPEAMQIVLNHSSAEKLRVLPWELSIAHHLSWEFFDQIVANKASKKAQFIKATCSSYEKLCRDNSDNSVKGDFVLCDVYAMMLLLAPDIVRHSQVVLGEIALAYDETRGASHWRLMEQAEYDSCNEIEFDAELEACKDPSRANARIITNINLQVMKDFLLELAQ